MKTAKKITFLILLLMTSYSFSQTSEEIEELEEEITKISKVIKIKNTELSNAKTFLLKLKAKPSSEKRKKIKIKKQDALIKNIEFILKKEKFNLTLLELKKEILDETKNLTKKKGELNNAKTFLTELKSKDKNNSFIKIQNNQIEKIKNEVLNMESKLYALKLKEDDLLSIEINRISAENVSKLNKLSREIDAKHEVHLLNEIAKKKFKNTKITYKATILNTNFSIPIARFNFSKNDSLNKGNIQLFNSIGAGFGISWGRMTDYRDENGELENSDFANTFSIHGGILFSAGNNNNVFAPVLSLGLLDFQLGLGYELGNISKNQKRGFITIGYAIPLYKLTKGKYWFARKSGIVNEIKFDH
jgi:hypothetical protein